MTSRCIDRQAGPGMETSFANAGEISPGYASPWAGPGIPLKAVKWLLMRDGPLVVRPRMERAMWVWLAQMLRNCTSARYAINKARMVPLAEYSRDSLRALREATGIRYDERSQGTLQLFRNQQQLDGTGKDIEVLKQFGVPFELLDPAGCIGAEPALARVAGKIAGGLRLPGDETGDCKLFTERLAKICMDRGVTFQFGVESRSALAQQGQHWSCRTAGWRHRDPRRRLCHGVWKLFGALDAKARCAHSGLSGQRLFNHHARHRCRCSAGFHHHGRDLQGCDYAARRPHQGGWHGGNIGFRHDAS